MLDIEYSVIMSDVIKSFDMHLSFKRVCNREYKGIVFYMTSSSYSFQSTHPLSSALGRITHPF